MQFCVVVTRVTGYEVVGPFPHMEDAETYARDHYGFPLVYHVEPIHTPK